MIDALRSTIALLPLRRAYNLYNRKIDVRTLPARLQFWKLRKAYYTELWAQAARNVNATFTPSENGFHRISRDGLTTIVNQTRVRLNDSLAEAFLLDKALTQDLLANGEYPIPKFRILRHDEFAQACAFMIKTDGPVVVKAASGTAGGKSVTTNIHDEGTLRCAFKRASRYCDKVLVEEHVEGHCYRLTYLGGKFIDAVRRGPPTVIGDGKSTIAQLIKQENKRRLHERPISSLIPILKDADLQNCLHRQGLSKSSRPDDGQLVTVKSAINENSSRDSSNVASVVHPEIIGIGQRIVEELGLEWAGLDIQCREISAPVDDGRCRVLEVNAPAGIHHHYLIDNKDALVPVAELLLEYMFASKNGVMRI